MWERFLKRPFLSMWIWTLALHVFLFAFVFPRSFLEAHATDGSQYLAIARNLLDEKGFSLRLQAPYIPDTIRTPIYPYFLASAIRLGGSPFASLPIILLLGTLIPLVGMLVARELTDDRRLWLVAGLILSLDPNLWYYSFILGSEGVFLPLVAGAIGMTVISIRKKSWKWGLGAGAVMGLAALTRPIVQFVPPLMIVLGVYAWFSGIVDRKQVIKITASFCAAYLVVVSPWLLRSYRLFGVWDYSNVGWFNMYTRVAATAEAIATHRPYDPMRIEYLQRLHDKGYVQKTPVEEQDVHGYAFKPIFQKETWEAVKKYPKETALSQVSAGWTVVSQDISILILRNLGWVKADYPTFSPLVLLAQEGVWKTIVAVSRLMFTPWIIAILARPIWLALFVLAFLAPFLMKKALKQKGEGIRWVILMFSWFYMLGIVALSLNAAAQADGRYRSQFIFVEIPLALVSIEALRQKRKKQNSIRCRACQTTSWTSSIGARDSYQFWKCHLCGTVTVDPMPSEEVRRAFYSKNYFFGESYSDYDADKIATRHTYEKMLDMLEPYKQAEARLLDIGSATGMFLSWAKERGWKVMGQEISVDAAEAAQKKGIETTTENVLKLQSKQFEVITLLDVVEHLEEPKEVVQHVRSLLGEKGIVFFNTPDAGSLFAKALGSKWHALCPPEHLVIFSEKGLKILLEQSGFEVLWSGRIPKTFRLSYIFGTAGRWLHWKRLNQIEKGIRVRPRLDISIPLPLRDNIAIIARKRL